MEGGLGFVAASHEGAEDFWVGNGAVQQLQAVRCVRSLPHPVPPRSPGIGEHVQESVLRVSVPWGFRLLGMAPWRLGGAVTHGLAVVALPHNRFFLGGTLTVANMPPLLSTPESLATNAQVAHLNVSGSSLVGGVRGVCAWARGSAWADGTAEAYS